ncbi:MAG TPA: ParB/RepB/Spo0J family partition protein [Chthoniobacterales bacterium]|nr:ParB/RepB/Spo0J family partition protein [Chthoniobacterales bacterium]
MAKSALGKGLGALIGTRPQPAPTPAPEMQEEGAAGEKVQQVPLSSIVASPLQPRTEFAPEALQELVDSIRQHGIIQPLIVRMVNGKHELIAGERRWRASQQLGLVEAPVIVREASDRDVLELSLIENLQRADLNPIEEAQAYARLAREFEMRQEDIALKVGRSRAAVANSMRLLDLHEQVQSWVTKGLLSVGHAKALLGLKAQDEQLAVAETILRRSATVRDAERLVAKQLGGTRRRRRQTVNAPIQSAQLEDLQNRLQQHLGTRVTLHHGEKRGRIELEYYGNDDLERLLSALGLANSDS